MKSAKVGGFPSYRKDAAECGRTERELIDEEDSEFCRSAPGGGSVCHS